MYFIVFKVKAGRNLTSFRPDDPEYERCKASRESTLWLNLDMSDEDRIKSVF